MEDYQRYLSTLGEQGFDQMVLDGGRERIETSVLWGRYDEANALVTCFEGTVSKSISKPAILNFARRQAQRGNPWIGFSLITKVQNNDQLNPGLAFEKAAIECVLLNIAKSLIGQPQKLIGTDQKAWAAWIASLTTAEEIARSIRPKIAEASARFDALSGPSPSEKSLKSQIDSISLHR